MNALFNYNKDTMIISIGNNYGIKKVGDDKVQIYRLGILDKIVPILTGFDRRVLVVDLVEKCGVKKNKLAKALGISRTSIDTWLEIYRQKGLEGLVNSAKKGVGRKKESIKRPTGDKFKEIEKARKKNRELIEEQNIRINFQEEDFIEDNSPSDLFNEKYDFEENRYAGSLLYLGIFQHTFKLMSFIESLFGKYSIVIYLFLMMHVNRISSIEQLKTVFKKEFGRIIGIKRLYSHPIIWKLIHETVNIKQSILLKTHYFKYQLYKGLVSLWYLFIDGHFIPYTGKEKVHKNFHTQSGMMKPGQNEIFIHDIDGRIVYFDLQEGKGDMLEVIKAKSKEIALYIGNIPPLFVVDKEIWGVRNFLFLSGCRFVTWEKNTDKKEVNNLPETVFSSPFIVNDIEYQVYETEKKYTDNKGNSIKLRRIVIWNKDTNKRTVAVAQDSYEDNITIARAMLNRWGKSENTFKHMGNRLNIHYNPVLDISKDSEKQEIVNPEHQKLKKEIKSLKNELSKIEKKLGRKKIIYNKDGTVRKNRSHDKLQKQREELQHRINTLNNLLLECPERIDISKLEDYKHYKVIETEGKNLWDLSETIVWNSRKKLISLLKEYLPNERDLLPVLEAITSTRGWVKSTSDVIIVKLEALERPQFRQAQIQLCRKLNEMNIRLSNGKLLLYDVIENNKNVQK